MRKSDAPSASPPAAKPAAPPLKKATKAATGGASSAPRRTGPVTPAEARRHFAELLKAKQERVRQGPKYPAANAFTGRHDGEASNAPQGNDDVTQQAATPAPEVTYSETHTHGRGNQGVRNQK